jgi:hypothetical protein
MRKIIVHNTRGRTRDATPAEIEREINATAAEVTQKAKTLYGKINRLSDYGLLGDRWLTRAKIALQQAVDV